MVSKEQVINYASVKLVVAQMVLEGKIKSEGDLMETYKFVAKELNIPLGLAQSVTGDILKLVNKTICDYEKELELQKV